MSRHRMHNKHCKTKNGDDDDNIIDVSASHRGKKINAGDGNDTVIGSSYADRVNAGDGDDTVEGGSGNDILFGNGGFDTAVFAGSVFDFLWSSGPGNSLIVTDLNAADGDQGTDKLKHFEALQFDDHTIYIDGTNNAPVIVADDQDTDEDTVKNFTVEAIDFDGDALTFESVSVTGGGSISLISSSPANPTLGSGQTYEFEFDPGSAYQHLADGDTATEIVTIMVSDGNGPAVAKTLEITINGLNDAPEIDDPAAATGFSGDFGGLSNLTVPNIGYFFIVDFDAGSSDVELRTGGFNPSTIPANGVVLHLNPNNADWGIEARTYSNGIETIRDPGEFTITGYGGAQTTTVTADFAFVSFLDDTSNASVNWTATDIDTPHGPVTYSIDINDINFTDNSGGIVQVGSASIAVVPGSGQIAFSDVDQGDTHIATVTGVTVGGDVSLLDGEDALTFLNLDAVDQLADTVDWQFALSDAVLANITAGLESGETLQFDYSIEIADASAASDMTMLSITLNEDGLLV